MRSGAGALILVACIGETMTTIGRAQAQAVVTKTHQSISIAVNPQVIQLVNGKLPTSMNLAVFENDCDDKRGVDLSQTPGYSLMITGSGLTLSSQPKANKCVIASSLAIDPNAPAGTYKVFLLDSTGTPVGFADLAVMDRTAAAIPPGLAPQVDVLWEVMSQNDCSDTFGKRVAQGLYCIQLKIGNNSGYPLQIAGIGFTKSLAALAPLGDSSVTIANSSYASTRAVLLQSQVWSTRNLVSGTIQAAGLLMAGFTPFFHAPNPKANFATAASIVSGPLLQGFNILFPDPVIAELKSLDDQSFRDNLVIPNNSHVQTVVFVEKQAVTIALQELNVRLNMAATNAGNKANAVQNERDLTPQQQAAANRAQALPQTLEELAASSKETAKNSTRPKWWKGNSNPLLVKLALGSIVIVGDEIAYLQRVQIQNSATPPTTPTPLTAVPSNLTFADQNVTTTSTAQSVALTNMGSSALSNVAVSFSGANSGDYKIESNSCASSLASAANCAISVTFTPANSANAPAKRTASLEVSYNPGSAALAVGLAGSAVVPSDAVLLSGTNLAFPTTKIGQTGSATVTISNFSKSGLLTAVSITAPTGSNSSDFSVSPSVCNNLAFGNACSITVTFKPAATGPRTAKIDVTYPINGVSQSQTVTLTGTGQ